MITATLKKEPLGRMHTLMKYMGKQLKLIMNFKTFFIIKDSLRRGVEASQKRIMYSITTFTRRSGPILQIQVKLVIITLIESTKYQSTSQISQMDPNQTHLICTKPWVLLSIISLNSRPVVLVIIWIFQQ